MRGRCGSSLPRQMAPRSLSPLQSANPRDLSVKNGDDGRPLSTSKLPFAGMSGQSTSPQVLLAMQKVEGSNPFSRSRKGLHLQVFFRVTSPVVRLRRWGLKADWRGRPTPVGPGSPVFAGICENSEPLTLCGDGEGRRFDRGTHSPRRTRPHGSSGGDERRGVPGSWISRAASSRRCGIWSSTGGGSHHLPTESAPLLSLRPRVTGRRLRCP